MYTVESFDLQSTAAQKALSARNYGGTGILPRVTEYGSSEAASMGLTPLLEHVEPVPPDQFESEIQRCHAKKIFPVYHQEELSFLRNWNQNGLGYCWAYSITACVMGCRRVEHLPHVRLAPESLGWLVNWRNTGYYMDKTIQAVREKGIAPAEYVPHLSIRPNQYRPGWQEAALSFRLMEWWDINCRASDSTIWGQALAILRVGRPLYLGFMRWPGGAHAVEGVGMNWKNGRPTWLIQNSHNDGVIEIQNLMPDEAYGPRATMLPRDGNNAL